MSTATATTPSSPSAEERHVVEGFYAGQFGEWPYRNTRYSYYNYQIFVFKY